ncbi:MAG: bifunctional DNA primase/polymerase [Silvanigrellaceae bacterium]|nr:bifunctional DNA primase/polymerase [Silvanigrellaceae bacterium]
MNSNNVIEKKNKYYLKNIILENKQINRFFPLYSMTVAKKCACNNESCNAVGKHPKVPFTSNLYRSFTPMYSQLGFLTGQGIVVVDVDIKEHVDGWQTLVTLSKPHGGIPDTLVVHTGGGGKHLYFRTEKKFKNKVRIDDGIDFRGENGFVVFPPSKHVSGNSYRFDDDSHPNLVQLAELPKWIEDLLEQDKTKDNLHKKFTDSFEPHYISDTEWEKIKEALELISSDCTRDFWREMGMRLYNTGRSDAFDVWDLWCKKSANIKRNGKSIYSRNDNIFQWNTQFSFGSKYPPSEILEIANLPNNFVDPVIKELTDNLIMMGTENEIVQDPIEENSNENDKYMNEAIKISQGFVKEYFEYVTKNSRYSLDKLHFLAAFSAISAVAQSGYLSPTNCSVSLYQMGFAVTGRGKDDVLYFIKDILLQVDQNILANEKFTSINGLLMCLYDYNSRIHVSDEVHTYFTPMLKSLPTSPLYQMTGRIMELWNHREYIEGISSRSFKIPMIEQPKFSLFTLSSMEGMKQFKDQQAINSGFLNRFLLAINRDIPKVNHEATRTKCPEYLVSKLKKIYQESINEDYEKIKNTQESLDSIISSNKNIVLDTHVPQRVIKHKMQWENEETKLYFHRLVERIDDKREILTKNKKYEEHNMYSRYAEQIVRVASLHAIGRDDHHVNLNDIKLAEKMLYTLSLDMLEFLDIDLEETQFTKYKKKIISYFKTHKRKSNNATLREITQILGTKTNAAEETLEEMVSQNILSKKAITNKNHTVTKNYQLLN